MAQIMDKIYLTFIYKLLYNNEWRWLMPRMPWEIHYKTASWLGDACKRVHLVRTDWKDGRVKYISIERGGECEAYHEEETPRGVRVFVTTPETIDKRTVVDVIARVHNVGPADVVLDFESERRHLRAVRYGHGLDPNLPPPGWVQD